MTTEQQPDTPAVPGVIRWRKKGSAVEAIHWDGSPAGATAVIDWVLANDGTACYHEPPALNIDIPGGWLTAVPGDWITRELGGGFWAWGEGEFRAIHEPASEPLSDAQCDRLRQMAGGRGDAVTAVKVALGYAAQPHAASAEIRDAAWAALETLSGSEEKGNQ